MRREVWLIVLDEKGLGTIELSLRVEDIFEQYPQIQPQGVEHQIMDLERFKLQLAVFRSLGQTAHSAFASMKDQLAVVFCIGPFMTPIDVAAKVLEFAHYLPTVLCGQEAFLFWLDPEARTRLEKIVPSAALAEYA